MGAFKVIPKEIKEQIMNRIKNEGVSVLQASSEHGVSPKTIYNWLKSTASQNISFLEYAKLKKENKLLLEIIGKLTLENSRSGVNKKK
jgi:transposase-like protein